MELRHLRYFVTVAEELSFTRASKRLGIAQPPLSQQIAKLERELGVALLERSSRAVSLTAAGATFLREARVLLGRAGEAARVVRQVGEGESGALRIGSVSSGFSGVLLKILPVFRERHPGITPIVYEMEATPQLEALTRRSIDVALLRVTSPHRGIRIYPLLSEPLVAALPARHPLSQRPSVAITDVAGEPLVMFPRSAAPEAFDRIIEACRNKGVQPNVAHEATNDHTLASLVACGLGVSLVPECTSHLTLPGVVYRPLADVIPAMPMCLAVLDPAPNPAAVNFLDIACPVTVGPAISARGQGVRSGAVADAVSASPAP